MGPLSSPFTARLSTSLTPVSRAVEHLAHSSLSITKRKERDCVQSTPKNTTTKLTARRLGAFLVLCWLHAILMTAIEATLLMLRANIVEHAAVFQAVAVGRVSPVESRTLSRLRLTARNAQTLTDAARSATLLGPEAVRVLRTLVNCHFAELRWDVIRQRTDAGLD